MSYGDTKTICLCYFVFVFISAVECSLAREPRMRLLIRQSNAETLSLPSNATSIREDITDNFSCENRTYGYFADVDNECQIFHVCLPVTYANGKNQTFKWSFICPESTVFNQEIFVCVREEDMTFSCEESEQYYELNDNFGEKLPDEDDTTDKNEEPDPNMEQVEDDSLQQNANNVDDQNTNVERRKAKPGMGMKMNEMGNMDTMNDYNNQLSRPDRINAKPDMPMKDEMKRPADGIIMDNNRKITKMETMSGMGMKKEETMKPVANVNVVDNRKSPVQNSNNKNNMGIKDNEQTKPTNVMNVDRRRPDGNANMNNKDAVPMGMKDNEMMRPSNDNNRRRKPDGNNKRRKQNDRRNN